MVQLKRSILPTVHVLLVSDLAVFLIRALITGDNLHLRENTTLTQVFRVSPVTANATLTKQMWNVHGCPNTKQNSVPIACVLMKLIIMLIWQILNVVLYMIKWYCDDIDTKWLQVQLHIQTKFSPLYLQIRQKWSELCHTEVASSWISALKARRFSK